MCFKFLIILISFLIDNSAIIVAELNNLEPKFSGPIANVTVPVGRDAFLTCSVHDLLNFKIAWLRVDTQTILTIHNQVITKNQRITLSHTEHRIWQLRIRDVKESDHGWYMCQINTDPMKSQVGYLNVVVPADIVDYETSHDVVVERNQNVTLVCTAKGLPEPLITWRREKDQPLYNTAKGQVFTSEGPNLTLWQVTRSHMGAYLCIASNGIPPIVSKRIMVLVNFRPTIWTRYTTIYVNYRQSVTLECISESHPISVNYWLKGTEIIEGGTYESTNEKHIYKIIMRLMVRPTKVQDFGEYKCIAKNQLGFMEQTIRLRYKNKHNLQHLYQTNNRNNQLIVFEELVTNVGFSISSWPSFHCLKKSLFIVFNFIFNLRI